MKLLDSWLNKLTIQIKIEWMIKIQLVRGLILSAKNFQTDEIGYEVCSLMQNKKMIFVKQ